ncbi:hypothetical protein Tco_1385740 [Tanacetum coccineum]
MPIRGIQDPNSRGDEGIASFEASHSGFVESGSSLVDPIVQSVDINTKATSYARSAGASVKNQPKVTSSFRPLMADLVFDGVNISIPRKVTPIVHYIYCVTTPTIEKTNDGFQMVSKRKKRKGKSKSTNGGQFVLSSIVKHC